MTLKDKLEIGLKEDAQVRKDNLPKSQVRGPQVDTGPGRSPAIPAAQDDRNVVPKGDSNDAAEDEQRQKTDD